eukprot:scaffold1440_cov114-Isochrysis_galbana.AAC.4
MNCFECSKWIAAAGDSSLSLGTSSWDLNYRTRTTYCILLLACVLLRLARCPNLLRSSGRLASPQCLRHQRQADLPVWHRVQTERDGRVQPRINELAWCCLEEVGKVAALLLPVVLVEHDDTRLVFQRTPDLEGQDQPHLTDKCLPVEVQQEDLLARALIVLERALAPRPKAWVGRGGDAARFAGCAVQ